MTTVSLALAILVALLAGQSGSDAVAAAASPDPAPLATLTGGCILAPGAGNTATTGDCTSCHSNYRAQHSHPVDVTQDAGRSRFLRPAAEVVKRGVFLADGRVTCLSCHDGNSTWKHKLALPPDAQVRPRVKAGNLMTFDPGMAVRTATVMPAGSDVSPTPLCKACHAFD